LTYRHVAATHRKDSKKRRRTFRNMRL